MKFKKIIYAAFFIFGWTTSGSAQNDFRTIYDDPSKIKPIKGYLLFGTLEAFIPGAGVHVEVNTLKPFTFHGIYRMDYLKNYFIPNDNIVSLNEKRTSKYGELSAEWHLGRSRKSKFTKLELGRSSWGGVTTVRYINVPVTIERVFSLNGGINTYAKWMFKSSSGHFLSDTVKLAPPSGKVYGVYNRSMSAFAGISTRRQYNTKVLKGGYYHYKSRIWQTYAQAMFLMGRNLEDLRLNNGTFDVSATPKESIGYRIGMLWLQEDIQTRIEYGRRPGVDGSYFLFSFGVTLYGKERYKNLK